MADHSWDKPYVLLQCPACGTRYPAAINKSPDVERELRCQRCLIATLTRVQRQLADVQVAHG